VTGLAHLRGAAERVLKVQTDDGAIPWFEDGPWDAWNHAECLMALDAMGEREAVARGFDYLARSQEVGGGWLCGYGNALPMEGRLRIARVTAPKVRDTNFAAYPATALWRHALLNRDLEFVGRYWPMVRSAIGFVLGLQHPHGDISWCEEAFGSGVDDAVLAGCASIYRSLEHAIALAELVGEPHAKWVSARRRLGAAIRERPERFDRGGRDRSTFAMDWYYPVLNDVMPAPDALARLGFGRARFIEEGRGCRCVATEPWVTVAESAELALTLIGLGLCPQAATLLRWQEAHRDADGAYWMGWQYAEDIAWPLEKPAWTQAAMILAQDALIGATRASTVLCARTMPRAYTRLSRRRLATAPMGSNRPDAQAS
jgi:hypothetical protein